MLRPAKADAFGAELAGGFRIQRGFRIGPHLHTADFIGPGHQLAKLAGQFRHDHLDRAQHDFTCATVDGDDLSFFICLAQHA